MSPKTPNSGKQVPAAAVVLTPTTYHGDCHCGRFQYSITVPWPLESLPSQIKSCDCSVCLKGGLLLVNGTEDAVTFKRGSLAEFGSYQFNKKVVSHKFCPTCGSTVMVDGLEAFGALACNVRMFRDVKLEELEVERSYNVDEDGTERWGRYGERMADVLV